MGKYITTAIFMNNLESFDAVKTQGEKYAEDYMVLKIINKDRESSYHAITKEGLLELAAIFDEPVEIIAVGCEMK